MRLTKNFQGIQRLNNVSFPSELNLPLIPQVRTWVYDSHRQSPHTVTDFSVCALWIILFYYYANTAAEQWGRFRILHGPRSYFLIRPQMRASWI